MIYIPSSQVSLNFVVCPEFHCAPRARARNPVRAGMSNDARAHKQRNDARARKDGDEQIWVAPVCAVPVSLDLAV